MDPSYMVSVIPILLPAFGTTLLLTALAMAFGIAVGVPLGTLRSQSRRRSIFAWTIDAYVAFVRGTPLIVQIFAAFFLLPEIGISASPFWIGILALAFNSAGYIIEIVRAAVGAVPLGQLESAQALGLTHRRSLILVVLPQAFRNMIPPMLNEISHILKASSVLSVLAVFELHKAANALMASSFRFLDLLIVQAAFYLSAVLLLEWSASRLAKRLSVSDPAMTSAMVR
jgi:polar amino acid transport system permease protein